MSEFVTVAKADEVGEGEVRAYQIGDQLVAVSRVNGELLAFSDICTHRQCNLSSGGEIEGTVIECECHGSRFDMKTGEVVDGPATDPIPVFQVRDEGGELRVSV